MWTIININLNKIEFFKKELSKKIGSEYKIYIPKIKVKTYKNTKFIYKSIPLLGNYIFCYHKKFEIKIFAQSIMFVKGINYVLLDYKFNQNEIKNFIENCRNNEDKEGYLIHNFLKISLNQFYQFKSGFLANKIFKLIDLQKNKIKILINNLKFEVKKENLLILPSN